MLKGFDENRVSELLADTFTPARPISRREVLFGRDSTLQKISRALRSPGKHIFIYGDRGVGKTSLATTTAYETQPSSQDLVLVACNEPASFFDIIQDAAQQLLPNASMTRSSETKKTAGFNFKGAHASISETVKSGVIPELNTVNDAVQLLKEVASVRNAEIVIVFDEFDQISSVETKKLFADFIKSCSDREIDAKFIFCGIGKSLEELIGVHLSTDRYIAPFELQALTHDARWEILSTGLERFGVKIDRQKLIRVGHMSDGFPYYIHLFGEHLTYSMMDDADVVDTASYDHFDNALRRSIEEANTSLKKRYEVATQKAKHSAGYERALWALSSTRDYERPIAKIYESYRDICGRLSEEPITKSSFYQLMAKLKSSAHGEIIEMKSRGWYRFNENIIRGYVRMTAANHGLDFGIDHDESERVS